MKTLEISNFKNFRHLKIDNLGSVNLIVGKNNTGKSTLLEAISILASGGNVAWLKKILELRGWNCLFSNETDNNDETLKLVTLCSLSYGRNFDNFKNIPIELKSQGEGSVSVEIKLVELVMVTETDETGSEYKRLIPKDKFNTLNFIVDG
ncbi:MAG: AAA family ATPase, partial [Muribaculaceae bacterium]|nr:AAA family ATPase [Muribaculaceae bacterium]